MLSASAGHVFEPAAGGVDGEPHRELRLATRADVEEPAIGAHRHRRRDPRLGDPGDRHLLDHRQVAALPVELQHVDFVALGVADVDQRGGARRRCHQRGQQDGRDE